MKNFRSAVFAAALLCAVSSSAAIAGSLTTTFSTGNSGRQGMYLDLTAINALTISNFVVNGDAGNWSVYYKSGTYAGSELDMSAWTLLGNGTTSSQIDTLDVGGLSIGAGETKALYFYDFSGDQYYNDDHATYANADLSLEAGTGNYGFFEDSLADRNWSGTVNYELDGAVPEPASWAMMVGGFGLIGGALRTRRRASVTFA